tara:strand:- start:188 stop:577 length:390 start_codon:yes stop_codon:yes gene_type:complete
MNIYDYIISLISSSPTRPTIKHKNSEDISDDDIEETTLLNPNSKNTTSISTNDYTYRIETVTKSKIPIPLSRSKKKHVHFDKYPIYQCGYCDKSVQMPQYLCQDMVFCSIMCRTRHISVVQNTKQNIVA